MQPVFKAGAVQFDVTDGDVDGNLATAFLMLDELALKGVALAVLPELFSCGFDNERIGRHAQNTPEVLARMTRFARDRDMAVAGTLPEADGGRVFNTLYFIDRDGEIRGTYRKLHLFPLTGEHLYYTAGNRAVAVDTSFGRIGLMICYDLRFPELARKLFLDAADVFVVSAQWPTPRAGHWQALIRARAIENQAFFICSNRTGGGDGELMFPGLSTVVGPTGDVLAEAGDTPGVICCDMDMGQVAAFRRTIPIRKDRREDIYG
ncbi:MAG TPA: carbon-nitrogen family hydrolase [Desulfobacteraceae bacterium]|nr:carbon-nitrogen family hydrolase [Desulfobacteraceae bacterium]